MRLRRVVPIVLSAGLHSPSAAQTAPRAVQPERPTVATHAGTVAPGYLEIESGGELDRYPGGSRASVIPTVFKVGLSANTQLSVFAPLSKSPAASRLDAGDLSVGIKWRIADDLPVLGRFAVLPTIKLPTGTTTTGAGTGTTDASLLLISSHDIGPVSLDINAGFTHRGGDGTTTPRSATLWTISTGGPAAGMLGWVAELYGYPATAGPAGQTAIVATLFGPTASVLEWLALDAGIIVPVSGPQPRAVYFGGVCNIGRIVP